MSFIATKTYIDEGDTVMLYLSVNNILALEVVDKIPNKFGNLVENKFQTIYGALNVKSLVGKKYGSKITLPKGWAYVLHPTCELWTKTVNHRTQIIYTPDISLILFGLDIVPGSKVIEAGTGTGSLSHAFIRAVAPTGQLYTFDFHEQRAKLAREEFHKHGLSNYVTATHRDVIANGFGVDCLVDAIFLDLPNPWEAVGHVRQSLRRGGKFCSFSPCIEQVMKTCDALKATGAFVNIKTQEVLQRSLSVQNKTMTSLDLTPREANTVETVVEPEEGVEEDGAGSVEDTGEVKAGMKRKLPRVQLKPVKKDPVKFRSFVPPATMPGHTGYITFATMVVGPAPRSSA